MNRSLRTGSATRSVATEGWSTCTAVGFYVRRGTPVPLWKMYMKSATLRVGVSHPSVALPGVMALIESGRFDPARVNTLVAPWDDAPRALLERSTKVVVHRAPLGLAMAT